MSRLPRRPFFAVPHPRHSAARQAVVAVLACAVVGGSSVSALAVPGQDDTSSRSRASAPPLGLNLDESPASRAQPDPDESVGPYADPNRPVAPVKVTTADGVTSSDFDLGTIDLTTKTKVFASPVRGQLYVPGAAARQAKPAPLVIFHHMRAITCADHSVRYPCKPGVTELRWDRGMAFLGRALAKQGYAVLIPDLAPALVGGSTQGEYSQDVAYARIDTKLLTTLRAAVAGTDSTSFGTPLTGAINLSRAHFIGHSRSGSILNDTLAGWAKNGPIAPASLMTMGAAYRTNYTLAPQWSPAPPEVPMFAMHGALDWDTRFAPNLWMTHHVASKRVNPAFVARFEGYGHTYFNQLSPEIKYDDRNDCGNTEIGGPNPDCRDAAQHATLLINLATEWLGAVEKGERTAMPLRSTDQTPIALGGESRVKVLAMTPGAVQSLTVGTKEEAAAFTSLGATSKVCQFREAGDPAVPKQRCPDPHSGTFWSDATWLRAFGWKDKQAIRYQLAPKGRPVKSLVLHISALADYDGGTPLRVRLIDVTGRSIVFPLSGNHPALMNTRNKLVAGSYATSTIRIPMGAQKFIDASKVVYVSIAGTGKPAQAIVRSLQVL